MSTRAERRREMHFLKKTGGGTGLSYSDPIYLHECGMPAEKPSAPGLGMYCTGCDSHLPKKEFRRMSKDEIVVYEPMVIALKVKRQMDHEMANQESANDRS